MKNALLQLSIPGKNLGLMQQAIYTVFTQKGLTMISLLAENILYSENCMIYLIPKDGEIIPKRDESLIYRYIGDVMEQYGTLTAEENKKPIFEVILTLDQTNKMSEVVTRKFSDTVDFLIARDGSYRKLTFYKKATSSETEGNILCYLSSVVASLSV
jgi:hypothetical protein